DRDGRGGIPERRVLRSAARLIGAATDRPRIGDVRGSSSDLGDCRWPGPPSRAEIPVDRESHGIRPVEGIGVPGFRSAGKLGRLVAGWPARRDRPDGLRTRQGGPVMLPPRTETAGIRAAPPGCSLGLEVGGRGYL